MESTHPYKQWENKKPQCEDFGFSEKDIPKIEKAKERFENISSFVPSDELESLRKGREELIKKPIQMDNVVPKKKDLVNLELLLDFIIFGGIVAAIGTKGFTVFSWSDVGTAFFIAIFFTIPGVLIIGMIFKKPIEKFFISPLDSLINKKFHEASEQVANQEKRKKDQVRGIEDQIRELEIKEAERHRKYIQVVFGKDYALSDNLNNYYNALNYYNNCRDSRRSEYWDKFQGGNGNDFEKACAKYLDNKGFTTRVTPIGPDKGIDIYAYRDGQEYACQCKALGSKVSSGDVQKFIGVLMTGPYTAGFFFSLNGFSDNALQIAQTSPKQIYCLSKNELMKGRL